MSKLYNDYPSFKLTEEDLSVYTPAIDAEYNEDKAVGLIGYANWGKIGVNIVTPSTKTKAIGDFVKEDALTHIAMNKVLATGNTVVFYRMDKTGSVFADGSLIIKAGVYSNCSFSVSNLSLDNSGSGNISLSIFNEGEIVLFNYNQEAGSLQDIIDYFNNTYPAYTFTLSDNVITIAEKVQIAHTLSVDVDSDLYILAGGSNPANVVGSLGYEIKLKAKYKGDFGNKIKVELVQKKDTADGLTYIYSYNLIVYVNDIEQKTYKDISLVEEDEKYLPVLLNDDDFVTIEEYLDSSITQEIIDASSIWET